MGTLVFLISLAGRIYAAPDEFASKVQPFLARNCYACHNAKLQSGGLNMQDFQAAGAVAQNREKFDHIVEKLAAGEMPPAGIAKPNPADVTAVLASIKKEMDRIDLLAKPDPGHVTARRLNRTEYNNSVRDLLGQLFDDLRPHIFKEEQILFPYIVELEQSILQQQPEAKLISSTEIRIRLMARRPEGINGSGCRIKTRLAGRPVWIYRKGRMPC